jgi:hypothetical protein
LIIVSCKTVSVRLLLGLGHSLVPLSSVISAFCLRHIPTCNGTNNPLWFALKYDREISAPEGGTESCIMSPFRPAEKGINYKHLLDLVGFNAMS